MTKHLSKEEIIAQETQKAKQAKANEFLEEYGKLCQKYGFQIVLNVGELLVPPPQTNETPSVAQ